MGMGGNYNGVYGARHVVFEDDHNDQNEPLVRDNGAKVEEFYYEQHQGDLQLTFTTDIRANTWERSLVNGGTIRIHRSVRIDDPDSHWVNVPIKATKKWDEFVDSLPQWDSEDE